MKNKITVTIVNKQGMYTFHDVIVVRIAQNDKQTVLRTTEDGIEKLNKKIKKPRK